MNAVIAAIRPDPSRSRTSVPSANEPSSLRMSQRTRTCPWCESGLGAGHEREVADALGELVGEVDQRLEARGLADRGGASDVVGEKGGAEGALLLGGEVPERDVRLGGGGR